MRLIAGIRKEDLVREHMEKLVRDLDVSELHFVEFVGETPKLLYSYGGSGEESFSIERWCINEGSPIITTDISRDLNVLLKHDSKVLERKALACVPLKWRGGRGTITVMRQRDFSSEEIKRIMEIARALSSTLEDYAEFRYRLIASSLQDLMERLMDEKPVMATPLHWVPLLERVIKDLLKNFGYPQDIYQNLKLSVALFYPIEDRKGILPCRIKDLELLKRRCVALSTTSPRQYKVHCALSGSEESKICVPMSYGEYKVGIAHLHLPNEEVLDREVLEDIIVFLRYYAASELISLYHAYLEAEDFLETALRKVSEDKLRGVEDLLRELGEFLFIKLSGVDDIFIYKRNSDSSFELIFQGSSPKGIHLRGYRARDPQEEYNLTGRSSLIEDSLTSYDIPIYDESDNLVAFITVVDKDGEGELTLSRKLMIYRLLGGLRWIISILRKLRTLDRDLYQLRRNLKTEITRYRRNAKEWERRARELEKKIGSLEMNLNRKEFIYQLSAKLTGISSTENIGDVLNWVVTQLPEVLNFSVDVLTAFIWWPLKGYMELVAHKGLTEDMVREISRRLSSLIDEKEFKEAAFLSSEPFIPKSDSATFRLFPELGRYRTVIVAPMIATSTTLKLQGGFQGVLFLASRHKYREEDIKDSLGFIKFVTELLGTYLEIYKLNRFSYKLSTAFSLVTEYLAKFSREYMQNREFSYYAHLMMDIIYQVMTPHWIVYAKLTEEGELLTEDVMLSEEVPNLSFKSRFRLPDIMFDNLKRGKFIVNVHLDLMLDELPEEEMSLLLSSSNVILPLMTSRGLKGIIWVLLKGTAITEVDLKLLGFLQQAINISFENFSLYQEISDYKNLLEATFRSISDGLIVLDLDRRIALMNPVAERLLELDSSVLGKKIVEVFNDRYTQLYRYLEELEFSDLKLSGDEKISGEDKLLRGDGRQLFIQYTISSVKENGSLKGYMVTIKDITVQKEIEQERNDMIALLSHDIRNPLTVVRNYISMMISRADAFSQEDKQRFLVMAKRELDRMTRMLNNLIDLVKLQTGGLKLTLSEVNLSELIRYYVESYSFASQIHSFKADIPEEDIWVKADREMLQQILDNLMSNAVKYSPSGGTITLGVKPAESPDEVIVYVKDQGIGIPEHEMSNLFRKYSRIKSARSKGIKGTGLGLYITKMLIEQLGGRIWVKSKEGEGTTFFFTLKLAKSRKELGESKPASVKEG